MPSRIDWKGDPVPFQPALVSPWIQITVAIALAIGGVARGRHAVSLLENGSLHSGLEMLGLTVIVLGAILDPLNSVWRFLPFGFGDIAVPPKSAKFAVPFMILGLALLILGWIAPKN